MLFGPAVLNGAVMVALFNDLRLRAESPKEAVIEGEDAPEAGVRPTRTPAEA